MGYSTDFLGHIDIDPALNDAEIEYLTAFGRSRRCVRPGGPYDVPGNPAAEGRDDFRSELYNNRAQGQPNLWCDWVPCWEGCCIAWNGTEKSYSMIEWLRYLIAHFLKPHAAGAGHPHLEGFTFDHRLSGLVVACRRDNKELLAVKVTNNRVTTRALRPADPRYVDLPPLPYEEEIDRANEYVRRRRRRPLRTDAGVVDLGVVRGGEEAG